MLGFVLTGLISLPNWNIDNVIVGVDMYPLPSVSTLILVTFKNSVGTVKEISPMTSGYFADKLNPQSPIDGTSTW